VEGSALVLNLLRFTDELRDAGSLDLPERGAQAPSVGPAEIKMAERLVESMTGEWKPDKYRDEYSADLRKLIDQKVKSGRAKADDNEEVAAPSKAEGKVVDIMHLLRESVAKAAKSAPQQSGRRRKAG
jgi:DNA end-binding protein Ku